MITFMKGAGGYSSGKHHTPPGSIPTTGAALRSPRFVHSLKINLSSTVFLRYRFKTNTVQVRGPGVPEKPSQRVSYVYLASLLTEPYFSSLGFNLPARDSY